MPTMSHLKCDQTGLTVTWVPQKFAIKGGETFDQNVYGFFLINDTYTCVDGTHICVDEKDG
jgi:hypothetical protein